MLRRRHKPIAWLLIATLAIVAGVNEGLHFLPGFGHAVEDGNRVLLLGVGSPGAQRSTDSRVRVERPDGPSIPIYDEDQCAICSVVGQSSMSSDSPQLFLVMPLVHDLPALALCGAPASTGHSFRARAPPRASFQLAAPPRDGHACV
jgi:hypothetical protein